MPRLYENEAVDLEQYYESCLETYISRDIKELSQVGDEMVFLNFMSNKKEIDLLIYQDGILTPVEIKKGSAPKNATKKFSQEPHT